ncbi:Poly-beta-hydroxybutyrate polymerase [Cupriavidus sp. H19C3]|uniref:PHA/PHB synthase family protein n=1 Tax=Cupriavidus sp. H19C3 TaxID=3241603 RepID=UPI003BF84493
MKRDLLPAACPEVAPLDAHAAWDKDIRAALATATGGISIASLSLAWLDWSMHLAVSPGRCLQAGEQWLAATLADAATPQFAGRAPVAGDPRFAGAAWQRWPWCTWRDAFLRQEAAWETITSELDGVSPHHLRLTAFCARQWLDLASPSNLWWMNPAALEAAAATFGGNFVQGASHWLEDMQDLAARWWHLPTQELHPAFSVGRDVAITPGKVVFRNARLELIQYAPTTDTVAAEPLLVVPSWIMKYYILDLQPVDSLVRHAVAAGHTVFMVSWKNPGKEARDVGLNDYLRDGLLEALRVVRERCGGARVHAAGYCLGGTLLTIAAAWLAREHEDALRSVTLFATGTDFELPGELGLFIDDSALSTLDALMRHQGYLDGPQMTLAFQMLHARDLVWSRNLGEYLLGRRARPNDLIAWNRDTTRLPYRLHADTLRSLFLRNDLAEGRYCVGGEPVALTDIAAPIFMVGTEHDHVTPWRSAYKLHLLTRGELTFVLTSGGHNAGIVAEPGHPNRRYRVASRAPGQRYRDPDRFLAEAARHEGSWWPCWFEWLAARDSGRVPARDPAPGALVDAPGTYVLES